MKVISEAIAAEILAGQGLAFGSWKQVTTPHRLFASVTPSRDFRVTWFSAAAIIEWLGAEEWLLCSFDLSNAVLEAEAEAVGQVAGSSISIIGDRPILFDRTDLDDVGRVKSLASALLGFEMHCYLVAKGKHGVRCVAFLDGVIDFVHGDQGEADRLSKEIASY